MLLERLEQASLTKPSSSADSLDRKEEQLAHALGATEATPPTTPLPAPGTAHMDVVVSAAAAAAEKIAAGEGRHVEHVALHTPASDALVDGTGKRKRVKKH